jgi:hypothetical protein
VTIEFHTLQNGIKEIESVVVNLLYSYCTVISINCIYGILLRPKCFNPNDCSQHKIIVYCKNMMKHMSLGVALCVMLSCVDRDLAKGFSSVREDLLNVRINYE